MTDARAAAPTAAPLRTGGVLGFLGDALSSLRDRRLVLPVLLLTVMLTGTNIVLALNLPSNDEELRFFGAVALVRVLAVLVLAVAILRILNRSPRPAWRPDRALWLYGATFLFGLGLTLASVKLFGSRSEIVSGILTGVAVSLIGAPFAAWFTAIAVERPLAWRAGRWLRGFRDWLPPLVLWSLVLVVPLGQLHAAIDTFLVRGAGEWFWPLALIDGPLSVVLALLGLSLASAAYRRVARG